MPKRATVKPNVDAILKMVASNSWSAASFSKMVGKHKRWLSEVKRGNNLPSPEEAARMCVLLQTTPEVILLNKGATEAETAELQADIALVRDLLDQQRTKKAPTGTGEREDISPAKQALLDAIDSLSDEQCEKLLIVVEGAKKLL